VLIAQEKMSHNHVYVFKKQPPSKYSYVAEIRSCLETGSRPTSTMYVKMLARGGKVKNFRVVLFFCSLLSSLRITKGFGWTNYTCYYSIHSAGHTNHRYLQSPGLCCGQRNIGADCLRFQQQRYAGNAASFAWRSIRNSGSKCCAGLHWQARYYSWCNKGEANQVRHPTTCSHLAPSYLLSPFTRYAREILQKEMLPHVGISKYCETKKAYFFGYMVHRLLLAALSKRPLDDRDHYGNKRLDLAGPLLGSLFRQLFKKLTKDVKTYLQKVGCLPIASNENS